MKLGMVFEGGANRTVFSCGVMDKFLEENIMPDYYSVFPLEWHMDCHIFPGRKDVIWN